eukprot:12408978-Karenia_brevis.AAC.1
MNKQAAGHHPFEMREARGGLVEEQVRRARVPGDRLAARQTPRKWCVNRKTDDWAPCSTIRTMTRGQACAVDIGSETPAGPRC